MNYSDTTARTLTITDSNTNVAHNIWFAELTPMQRYEVGQKVDKELSGLNKLNACLNYIEDNLDKFVL